MTMVDLIVDWVGVGGEVLPEAIVGGPIYEVS